MPKHKNDYVPTSKVTKFVKHVLAERYGHKNVSVTSGRGTASSWVEAMIKVGKPEDCHCEPNMTYCKRCCEHLNEASQEARKLVYAAMEKVELRFSTYTADDGYWTERDCFLLQTRFYDEIEY